MVTEHTPPDGRPRSSFVAAAAALCRLGRLRDVPVVLMLAWAGWLAIPWPLSGIAQARSTSDQALSTGVARGASDQAVSTGVDRGASDQGLSTGLRASPPRSGAEAASLWSPADTAQASIGARDPIASERARIAAEVHDAAGHGLAVIAMQAGVALLMLDEDPEQVRASLEAIRSTSMQALGHLRSALDGIDPATPDEGLAGLVGRVRAAGLPVVLVPAEPSVPAHLAGTVHRVVRESLTNVLRHAGPTEAVVNITGDAREFVLEVTDRGRALSAYGEGRGPSTPAEGRELPGPAEGAGLSGPVEGRGLAGMRAQVREVGGTFGAGPREGGGFRVVARFPLETV
ncbi:histidine kinase [Sphaerisporangium sp. NPDC051017]|uniref:sensor histidine kinase n=1 Tax=Sphaerisporangium sp. NPDC051017 TaxID=3154636 RepID=UPI003421AC47